MDDLAGEILGDPAFSGSGCEVPRGPGGGNGADGGSGDFILYRDAAPLLSSGWLVKELLPRAGLAAVYGPAGCGKTFVLLDMLLHVATGAPWRGLRTRRAGVLYLSPDGGRAVQNRLAAWRQHHSIADADFALAPGGVDLLGKMGGNDVARILTMIAALEGAHGFRVEVVVVDTCSRAMPAGDENQPADMTSFIANLARVQGSGDRLMIGVHHTPKSDATIMRGHSSLHGACDCELNVAERAIRVAKQRDGAAGAVYGFDLKVIELGHDADGDAVTSCVAVEAAAPDGRQRPLSPTQKVALDTLQNLIAKHPRELPDGPNYPTKTSGFGQHFGASLSGFREEFYNRCEPGQNPDTKSRAFRRALKELQAIGKVAVYGDWIWCPDKPDKAGQT